MNSLKILFMKGWVGQQKLWLVFWVYSLILSLVNYLLMVVYYSDFNYLFNTKITRLEILINSTFMVLISVPIWRCANNCNKKFWGIFARIFVVISVLIFILGTFIEYFDFAVQLPEENN